MAFEKKYIAKEPESKGPNTEFGSVVHRVFEKIMRARVEMEEYDVPGIIESSMSPGVAERAGEIYDIVEKFVNIFRVDASRVAGIEEKLAVDIDNNPVDFDDENAYFRGVIDLLEIDKNVATITDYKTQFNILSDDDMNSNIQLSRYCWLVKKHFPQIDKFVVKIYFARYGATRSSTRSLGDVVKTGVEIGMSVRGIEKTETWDAMPSDVCLYCGYSKSCPLVSDNGDDADVLGSDVLVSEESAQSAARTLVAMKERIKKLERSLRDYCAENGSVRVSEDYSYGFVDRKTSVFDSRKVIDFMIGNMSEDISEIASTPATKINKYIKKMNRIDPDLADMLEYLRENTVKTDFKGFKDA